jgi:prefoldin subunit 5
MASYKKNILMSVPKNKKISTVFLTAIMVLSLFAILSMVSQPAFATAAGSVSYTPDVFSSGSSSTLVSVNGGTFAAGSNVYFYLSTSDSYTGITGSYVGFVTLPSTSTTLNYMQTNFHIPSVTAGTYYLFASDSSSPTSSLAQFTSPSQATVTALNPSISVSGTQPTTKGTISGSGWDPSSTVDVYLAGSQGSPLYSVLLSSVAVTSSGSIASGTSFSVPSVAEGSYSVVAEEASSSTNNGITADSTISITPLIAVSPFDSSGLLGSQFTVSGYGFPSLSTIPANAISVGSSIETSSATTASSSGTFSVAVTLAAAITTTGYYAVTARYNTSSYTQSNSILVSIPNDVSLGFSFTPTSASFNLPFTATVWNFPSDSQVSVTLGPSTLGQFTTDSNGYGQATGYLPALTAGTYFATAQSSGLVDSIAVTVSSYFQVLDPSGVLMISSSEYFPSTGHYTVQAFGLSPTSIYTFADSAKSSNYQVGSVAVGRLVSESSLEFYPAVNGSLIFTFYPEFASTTTTAASLTLTYTGGPVSGYSGDSFGYTPVQSPTYSISAVTVLEAFTAKTMTITGIVPTGKQVYPGLSTSYNIYMGSSELSFYIGSSSQSTTVLSYSSASVSITFTAPASDGLYYLNLTYAGQSYTSSVTAVPVVVSSSGTSINSGTIVSVPVKSAGVVTGYYVAGYSFYQSASVELYYYTQTATDKAAVGLSYGGFSYSGLSPFPSEPSGSYAIIADASYSGTTYTTATTYVISPSFTATANGGYSGSIGASVSFTLSSFSGNTYYSLYFGTLNVVNVTTASSGSASGTFNVPAALPGKYNITVVDITSHSTVASEQFNVTGNPDIVLSTSSQYAFPGELVNFTASGFTAPSLTASMPYATAVGSPTIYATISLNSSDYQTVPASFSGTTISGSFVMPNDKAGTYFQLTITAFETQTVSYTIGSTSNAETGYGTVSLSYSGSDSGFLGLTTGNGAYILGVSQSQIAQIDSSINTTLSVPLSQLNAAISSINGDIATITTDFGTMTASLSSINATVTSINSGVVSLKTTLGQVKTSLTSLNATVVALNNDTATISTAIGKFTTTVNNINATVTIGNGNIATIKTDLGTFTGNVTSVSNGIATIQTSLGTIKTYTQATSTTGLVFILEIVILVLAVIAVAFSAMAMSNTRKKF